MTLTQDEQLKILIEQSIIALIEMTEKYVPEKGEAEKAVSVSFNVPFSDNMAKIFVEESASDKDEKRDLIAGVHKKEEDRLTSRILLPQKSKQDIIEYLKNPENQTIIKKYIIELSQLTDNN